MSLAHALRRNMLKAKARRLFIEIKAAPSTRFRGPNHARRLARLERDFHSTMAKLAEVDPAAAELLKEGAALREAITESSNTIKFVDRT